MIEELELLRKICKAFDGYCELCAHCIPAGHYLTSAMPACDFEALGGDQDEK